MGLAFAWRDLQQVKVILLLLLPAAEHTPREPPAAQATLALRNTVSRLKRK